MYKTTFKIFRSSPENWIKFLGVPLKIAGRDRCIHNIDDQMNLQFQGSLSGSSGNALAFGVRGPGCKIPAGAMELFQKLQILFL